MFSKDKRRMNLHLDEISEIDEMNELPISSHSTPFCVLLYAYAVRVDGADLLADLCVNCSATTLRATAALSG